LNHPGLLEIRNRELSSMSYDEPQITERGERVAFRFNWIYVVLALLGLGGVILIWTMTMGVSPTPTKTASGPKSVEENRVEAARQDLSRQTDLNACRGALKEINAELSEKPALRPPTLTSEQKSWLHEHLSLSNEEMAEVESSHFTRLDNQHLFSCLLF